MARPVLRTALCDLLGVEYPVISAGMGPVGGGSDPAATAPLVAAVSNAGGLGVIGGAGFTPDELRDEIRRVRAMTTRPFGVDLLLPSNYMGGVDVDRLPADPRDLVPAESRAKLRQIAADLGVEWCEAPLPRAGIPGASSRPGGGMSDEQMETVIEERVPVFASGLGNPGPWIERLHASGTVVLSLVGNVKNARRVADAGADVVVAQGTEAGGHTGRVATLALVPQVIDAVAPRPVVAAGGIADGRGLAAALALGAVGVWCGTAFLVADEANQPDTQKERILAATDEDTRVTKLYSGKTMRNIVNPLVEAWEASGIPAMPMGLQNILTADLIYSVRKAGRDDLLMNAAGQISGLLSRSRPAADILADMVASAVDILTRRLPAAVTASAGA
ncbi:MAG: nitronate monooxygenase [Dehalococcoidia bacterium]|nr:nitronate monooxygenase [Dehalococcoidia bacterium]